MIFLKEAKDVALPLLHCDVPRFLRSSNANTVNLCCTVDGDVKSAAMSGKQHQLAHVVLQTKNVCAQRFLGNVLAPPINTNADCGGVVRINVCSTQLLDREAAAKALLHVITNSRACNLRAEKFDRTGENLLSLEDAEAAAPFFLRGLVQENLDITFLRGARIEVFLLVDVRDGVVALWHCWWLI